MGIWLWGKVWKVIGWWELRNDLSKLRKDSIVEERDEGRILRDERGKKIEDL